MNVYVVKTPLTILIFFGFAKSEGDLSSPAKFDRNFRSCPGQTGQIDAQKILTSCFIGSKKEAEDTGFEPATGCPALHFQ